MAIPCDCNIRKKKHVKLEKYQGLKEELEKMWRVMAAVLKIVIRTLGAVTSQDGLVALADTKNNI